MANRSSVTMSYLGWMAYILHILLKHHTTLAAPTQPSNHGNKGPHPALFPGFCIIAAVILVLLIFQSSPINHYVYTLLPVPLWYAVVRR